MNANKEITMTTSTTTKKYRIESTRSGQDLGTYSAESEAGALDAMARDAGYGDHADACRESGDTGDHLLVTELVKENGGEAVDNA